MIRKYNLCSRMMGERLGEMKAEAKWNWVTGVY